MRATDLSETGTCEKEERSYLRKDIQAVVFIVVATATTTAATDRG